MSRETIAECLRTIEGVRDELAAAIVALTDNPGICRLSDRAFVISFKDLTVTTVDAAGHRHTGNNWSPAFHDFKQQHRKITDFINQGAPQDCYRKLERAVEEGRLEDRDKTKLHPDVVAHLVLLIGYRGALASGREIVEQVKEEM